LNTVLNLDSIPLINWLFVFAHIDKLGDKFTTNHRSFMERSVSELEHFNTVRFLSLLPSDLFSTVKKLRDPDLCAVTKRASYDDVVNLALQRMQQKWSSAFIDRLVRRIARGTSNGDFVRWDETRSVMYTLAPSLRGSLKGWDDYRNLDLTKVLKPSDFDDKDDVVVAEVLREQLINFDAFKDTFCVPGLYDEKKHFLHWNYRFPNGKDPLPDWSVVLNCDKGQPYQQGTTWPWWSVETTGAVAHLQPQKGMTVKRLQDAMAGSSLPKVEKLPYQVRWEDLDRQFEMLMPVKIKSGLQISCDLDLPPLVHFAQLRPIAQIPESTIGHHLRSFGIHLRDKDDPIEEFSKLLNSLYPSFEEQVLEALRDRPMIRVNPTKKQGLSNVHDMHEVLVPGTTHPEIVSYLSAFFLCLHTYGKAIVDPNFTSPLYTSDGVFGDLLRTGYPPPEASFASSRRRDRQGRPMAPEFLCFICPFGLPEAIDWNKVRQDDVGATAPVFDVHPQDQSMVDELDELLEDL
jgi:hypothetical protein